MKSRITDEQARGLIDFLRGREDVEQARERLGLGGGLKCTVRCWEDRIGLHFPHGPQAGTLVTFGIEVASDLHSFVSECSAILEE